MAKIKEAKEIILHTRITRRSFELLLALQARKQKASKSLVSRSDVIEDALRFIDGQIPYQNEET